MGMAASQARYLGLTARKTNTEYEGQQVNQARVALANQSAGLFNQLLTLEVPVAPSTADYTTVQYSYSDGITGETIESMEQLMGDPVYNYTVKHFHYANVFKGQKALLTNPQVATVKTPTDEIPTYVGTSKLEGYQRGANKDIDTAFDQICADWPQDFAGRLTYTQREILDQLYDSNGNPTTDPTQAVTWVHKYADGTGNTITDTYQYGKWDMGQKTTTQGVDPTVPPSAAGTVIRDMIMYDANNFPTLDYKQAVYMVNEISNGDGTTTIDTYNKKLMTTMVEKDTPDNVYYHPSIDGKIMFSLKEDLLTSAHSPMDPTKPIENQQIKLPEFYAQDIKEKIEQTQKAVIQINGKGRAESIRYEDSSATYVLETEQITDEAAYHDAMQQYNYARETYDKQIQDINAKTERIQAEDRTLELRLRQLDTEQEALQTEMEAVKKVIEKNIESTFKTFE